MQVKILKFQLIGWNNNMFVGISLDPLTFKCPADVSADLLAYHTVHSILVSICQQTMLEHLLIN